jgi:hypothetical protein
VKVILTSGIAHDCSHEIGETLIAAGLATLPKSEARVPDARWAVMTMAEGEPYIHARCGTCKDAFNAYGPTAHKTQIFSHCGTPEKIPQGIAQQYEHELKLWNARKKEVEKAQAARRAVENPSAALRIFDVNPNRVGEVTYGPADPALH